MIKKNIFLNITVISVITGLIAVYFQDQLLQSINSVKTLWFFKHEVPKRKDLFTAERLALHDGIHKKTLYLSILGTVFDVTVGKNHYKAGTSYNYFIGQDGSRAFVTGDFANDSIDKDHVLDLDCKELMTVMNWKKTFKSKYARKGKLIGRYYDNDGSLTLYGKEVKEKINQCNSATEEKAQADQKYPPCNSEWSANDGTKLWCSKNSGGISRNWEGVPRQLIKPGQDPVCVCVDLSKEYPGVTLQEYENCSATSNLCILGNRP